MSLADFSGLFDDYDDDDINGSEFDKTSPRLVAAHGGGSKRSYQDRNSIGESGNISKRSRFGSPRLSNEIYRFVNCDSFR